MRRMAIMLNQAYAVMTAMKLQERYDAQHYPRIVFPWRIVWAGLGVVAILVWGFA